MKGGPKQLPKAHRGSFAALLAFLKPRVRCDWDAAADGLTMLIDRDCGMMGKDYLQELFLQLHLFDIYSTDLLLRPMTAKNTFPNARTSLYGQTDLPSAICVTLKVPVKRLKPFTDLLSQPEKLGTPLVHGFIKSSPNYQGHPWYNCFAAVQLCFGNIIRHGEETGLDQRLTIEADKANWSTQHSPLLASFMVPSWVLLLEPDNAIVTLALQANTQSVMLYHQRLGSELEIYSARQSKQSEVMLSTKPPQVDASSGACRLQNSLVSLQQLHVASTSLCRRQYERIFVFRFSLASATDTFYCSE